MAKTIDQLINDLITREGGYVNDPNDAGGETNFGITVSTARSYGYTGSMKDLPKSTASDIYKKEYWEDPAYEKIAPIFPKLAEKLFDIAVNCGITFASQTLQRCLTALNNQGKDYPDLKVDGHLGPVTINALKAFLAKRGDLGQQTLLFMVAAQQSNRYLELAETKQTNESFLFGWESQRALYDALP